MALIIGTKFNDILVGTNSDDTIFDMDGNDTIVAGGGNDAIFAGKGGDWISGGDGVDTLHYGLSDAAVNVNLATHVGHGGYAEGDVIFEVENLVGSSFNDTLIGDSNANTINGGDGNDVIHGGGGLDTLIGGVGNDTLYSDSSIASFNGGDDIDTVDFSGRTESPYHYYHPAGVYVNLLHHVVGYDGPFPPFNDSLVHHYVFTLYALKVARAPLEGRFDGADARRAVHPHVLAEATHSGTYTLNRRLLG